MTSIADDITVILPSSHAFQINGGDPDPATTGIVPPDGDRLSIWSFVTELNIWSDKNSPPMSYLISARVVCCPSTLVLLKG